MKKILTGIKPTGSLHIGNYFGAIKPIIDMSKDDGNEVYCFVADLHALNLIKDPLILEKYTIELVATLLAFGLGENKFTLYLQSDIPQISELSTILMPFTLKGLMNRAHAYKSKVEENLNKGVGNDIGINMGLYTYPILMAADILILEADIIPIGNDQIQHIEICRDIASLINKTYKKEILKLPRFQVDEETSIIPGIDGNKMSKSYKNTIPLLAGENKMRKAIMKIKTDDRGKEEAKNPKNCSIFFLYSLFASSEQTFQMRTKYQSGISYGAAKEELFELIRYQMSEPQKKFNYYMNNQEEIRNILENEKIKILPKVKEKISSIKQSIGLFHL